MRPENIVLGLIFDVFNPMVDVVSKHHMRPMTV
jgi:hypothetical protein